MLGVGSCTVGYEQWSSEPIPALTRGGLEGFSWPECVLPTPNGGAIRAS